MVWAATGAAGWAVAGSEAGCIHTQRTVTEMNLKDFVRGEKKRIFVVSNIGLAMEAARKEGVLAWIAPLMWRSAFPPAQPDRATAVCIDLVRNLAEIR